MKLLNFPILLVLCGASGCVNVSDPAPPQASCDPGRFVSSCIHDGGGHFAVVRCAAATGSFEQVACPVGCHNVIENQIWLGAACDSPPAADVETSPPAPDVVQDQGDRYADTYTDAVCTCPEAKPCTPCPQGQACLAGHCYVGWCGIETCGEGHWCAIGSKVPVLTSANGTTESVCAPIQCALPAPATPISVFRVVGLTLAEKMDGCDLNGDGKPDNALRSAFGSYWKPETFDVSMKTGEYVSMFATSALSANGLPFSGAVYQGQPAPDVGSCWLDDPKGNCKVWIRKQSYVLDQPGVCKPRATCTGKLVGDSITATCTDPVPQAVFPKPEVTMSAFGVTLDGTLSLANGTGKLRICGAYRYVEIFALIDALPDKVIADFGVGGRKSTKNFLSGFAKADVDTDNDGVFDALSFAAYLTIGRGTVTGWTK